MKRRLLTLVILATILALAAGAFADTNPSTTYVECVAMRIDRLSQTATSLDAKASAMASASRSNPALATSLVDMREKLGMVRANLQPALCTSPTTAVMEQALIRASVTLSLVRSNVARINLALLGSTDESAKKAGREMSEMLDKIAIEIPPEEPTRGCR